MRALITGINGFVGGHLAEYLLASGGWELCGLARQAASGPKQLANVQLVVADLVQLDQTVAALEHAQPDVVFHLAGQSNVPRSFENPAATLTTNVLAQLHLFQAVLRLRQNPLLLIVGSNEIYGHVDPEDLPLT